MLCSALLGQIERYLADLIALHCTAQHVQLITLSVVAVILMADGGMREMMDVMSVV